MITIQDDKSLNEGDTWYVGEGYSIKITSIDTTAQISFSLDGNELESQTLSQGEFYTYSNVFNTTIESISAGSVSLKNSSMNSDTIGATVPSMTKIQSAGISGSTLTEGQIWYVSGGYSVYANDIDMDSNPKSAQIILLKDCTQVKEELVNEGENIDYNGEFIAKVNTLSGTTEKTIKFSDTSLSPSFSVHSTGYQTCVITCTEDWSCETWTECSSEQQTRECTDSNTCGTTNTKPEVTQACTSTPIATCTEDWNCTEWTECINNEQTKECTDSNSCGTTDSRPEVTQACNYETDIPAPEGEVYPENQLADTTLQQNTTSQNTPMKEKITSQIFEVTIQDEKISLEKFSNGVNVINTSLNYIKTPLNIIMKSSKLYVNLSGEEIEMKISPEQAVENSLILGNIENVGITKHNKRAVYSVTGTEKAKLFFIFPVLSGIEAKVDIETGEILKVERSWWHFLTSSI